MAQILYQNITIIFFDLKFNYTSKMTVWFLFVCIPENTISSKNNILAKSVLHTVYLKIYRFLSTKTFKKIERGKVSQKLFFCVTLFSWIVLITTYNFADDTETIKKSRFSNVFGFQCTFLWTAQKCMETWIKNLVMQKGLFGHKEWTKFH